MAEFHGHPFFTISKYSYNQIRFLPKISVVKSDKEKGKYSLVSDGKSKGTGFCW